jgi:uncharacterized SAM-binding protein YcdF (DUF218 family)
VPPDDLFASTSFDDPQPQQVAPRSSAPWPFAIALLTAIAVLFVLFLSVGRWLVVEDPLEKADAIVVLSGRIPMRALEAARLYQSGWAPQVWLTHPNEPTASLATLDIDNPGEDVFSSLVLKHGGVSPNDIHTLTPPISNTVDEVHAIASEAEKQNAASVIIVTTKAHTRRVHALWKKYANSRARIIVRTPADDPFDPVHWWRSTTDVLDVVREVLGIFNIWIGLPLRPAQP